MPEIEKNNNKYSDVPVRIKSWGYIIIIFGISLISSVTMNLFVCFLVFWSLKELLRMAHLENKKQLIVLGFLMIPELYILYKHHYVLLLTYNGFLLLCTAVTYFANKNPKLPLSFLQFIMPVAIVLFSLPHLAIIRAIDYSDNTIWGIYILILLVIPTELNDVFQYLCGKVFGKHKITPVISPNKTVEGFLGGLLLTSLLTLILGSLILKQMPWSSLVLLGVFIAILGFLGDVYMSKIKRLAGVKDTGNLIPGHGGLLDRIDSLLFITPIYYFLLLNSPDLSLILQQNGM